MNADWNVRHLLSAGGPLSACAPAGVSLGHAFPAGISNIRSNQLCLIIKMEPFLSTNSNRLMV